MSVRARILDVLSSGLDPFENFPVDDYPADLQGWHSQHGYLRKALEERRPKIIIEVGVWKGASVVTFGQNVKRLGLDAVIIAIDTWLGSAEHYTIKKLRADLNFQNGYPQLFHTFAANICRAGLQDVVIPLPLDSINAFHVLKKYNIRPDVIHIDAGHDLRSVTNDLEAWWPHLQPGGILIGDDYLADGSNWVEVKQAFDTFFAVNTPVSFESMNSKCYVRKPA